MITLTSCLWSISCIQVNLALTARHVVAIATAANEQLHLPILAAR